MSTVITPCDPNLTAAEKPRLARQCFEVLEALRTGPKSNSELAPIAIRYSARIHDLKKSGYDIQKTFRCYETGLVMYELVKEPK